MDATSMGAAPGITGRVDGRARLVFVLPGQGAQWVGMGRGLLKASPVFAATLDACSAAVEAELGWSPRRRLEDDAPLTAVEEIQPVLWAFQVALASVWLDWGVEPDLVIGHSMGEIAAATVAGALDLPDAAAVVCRRAVLLAGLGAVGAMWAVGLGEKEAEEAIGEDAGLVCAGVLNSDRFTVLSGDPDAIARIVEPLRERGVFSRRVAVGYASHGPQVEPIRAGLRDALADVRSRAPRIPLHSTVWDRPVDGAELDGGYWMENVRRPVRFASAVRAALSGGGPVLFVEVGPHPLLVSAVGDAIAATGAAAAPVASLVRRQPEPETLMAALGTVYAAGHDPDWSRVRTAGLPVPLPAQPWHGRRLWIEP
ncbi:acyltransferase domain-containing protein [Actinomadura graeca]|uniref:Acyltransferase domain-containing protein n=1 Tax=Actinomadura graeca TaxID=2750812 RepID=A0ABX8QY47_9ACTN|nr:acyltransferase domain-containing protein [Actinomadura graeca]QXJ22377.1 acyltransferase domain-containing protein [Actinomadura graeca]